MRVPVQNSAFLLACLLLTMMKQLKHIFKMFSFSIVKPTLQLGTSSDTEAFLAIASAIGVASIEARTRSFQSELKVKCY